MKNFLIGMTALLLASAPCSADNTKWRTEKLTRGVVAIPQSSSGSSYLVSWRMLDTDDDYTTFDVIKNGTVVKSDINSSTNYLDTQGSRTATYRIVTKHHGIPVDTTDAIRTGHLRDFKLMADYVHLSYQGTFLQWERFLKLKDLVPPTAAGVAVTALPNGVDLRCGPAALRYAGSAFDWSSQSLLTVLTGFEKLRSGELDWTVKGFLLQENMSDSGTVSVSRIFNPGDGADPSERFIWEKMKNKEEPFNGEIHSSGNYHQVYQIITGADPNMLYTAAVGSSVAARKETLKAEAVNIRKNLKINDFRMSEILNPPQPSAEKPQPSAEKPQPSAESTQPSAEKPQPNAGSPQPSAEKPQPSAEKPQPSAEKPQPSAEKPQPSAGSPQPSAEKPQPNAEKPQPSAEKPQPSAEKPQPSAEKPQPSAEKPQASAGKPQPNAEKPQPSAGKPQPSAEKPQPSAGKPQLSAGSPQPSAEKPQPNAEKPPFDAEHFSDFFRLDLPSMEPNFTQTEKPAVADEPQTRSARPWI